MASTPAPRSSSPLSIAYPVPDHDPATWPRHSPTITRPFDFNDPQVRERQRTLDVDMALQISRARRETIHHSPHSANFDLGQSQPSAELGYSLPEEREIERTTMTATPNGVLLPDDDTVGPLHLESPPHHPPSPGESSLFAVLDAHAAPTRQEDDLVSSARYDLPTYQANISRSSFDFYRMEQFAAQEKAKLGISSPIDLRPHRLGTNHTAASSLEAPSAVPQNLEGGPATEAVSPREGAESIFPSPTQVASPTADDTISNRLRYRKLSQSNPRPRVHRKGIGGKLALFESSASELPHSLSARLGAVFGGASGSGGSHDHYVPPQVNRGDGISGILNTGHDRPFRFSFYSNSLTATIHARSLSELPADGQSFRDLFSGIHPPPSPDMNKTRSSSSNPRFDPARKHTYKYNERGVGGDSDTSAWWLDVTCPTEEEMKMLSEVFSIHPLTAEDILMEETREKIELFKSYYFVCFRSFEQDQYSPTYLEPINMYIIVFREGILSFHFQPTSHPQNVRRRIKQFKDYITVTSDWISYALIDDITDAFGPLIQGIEYEVDSIDELVLILKGVEQNDMLRRIGTCRKKVMGLLRLMGSKADVVKGLAKRCNENWRMAPTSDIGLYLSDIQDHLITMTQNLNHYEKILSRSHSNYLAQISIEMTDANNQINDVLSKLTALGTVLVPMNLVTGLWGMNVHVPGQDVPGYAWFVGIIVCLAAFALLGGYITYRLMVRK